MNFNKIRKIFPAVAMALTAFMGTSCMDDLSKGNIDPNVEANPSVLGLYSKCYAGLIMEGNDGNADFTIDDAGKSTLLRVSWTLVTMPVCRVQPHCVFFIIV